MPRTSIPSDQPRHHGPSRADPLAPFPQTPGYPSGLLASTDGEDQTSASPLFLRSPSPSGLSTQSHRPTCGAKAPQSLAPSVALPPQTSVPQRTCSFPFRAPSPHPSLQC